MNVAGLEILVDEEDRARIEEHPWRVAPSMTNREGFVICAEIIVDDQKTRVHLPRFLLGPAPEQMVFRKAGYSAFDFRKDAFMVGTMADRQASIAKTRHSKSSTYKGVSFDRKSKKWRASIRPNGHSICIGYFVREEDAALAYNKEALFYFGDSAFQNSIADESTNESSSSNLLTDIQSAGTDDDIEPLEDELIP